MKSFIVHSPYNRDYDSQQHANSTGRHRKTADQLIFVLSLFDYFRNKMSFTCHLVFPIAYSPVVSYVCLSHSVYLFRLRRDGHASSLNFLIVSVTRSVGRSLIHLPCIKIAFIAHSLITSIATIQGVHNTTVRPSDISNAFV